MFDYKLGKYRLRLLDKNNDEELKAVQRLRYNDLLKEFNDELDNNGIDDDHYDKYSDSLIVIDEEENLLVGTYRLASYETGLNKLLLE
ncbi:MAG: GNAT family N-acetyltransferase, partial [Bacilli bacterium]|nr:GNAT family N-acetyltransferase [Bacilli bacterium]